MVLQTGVQAPAFEAQDQDNKRHSLSEYQGQWLLLYFYPQDDTPGCTTEACNFRDAFHQLKQSITVVGVSADSVESHAAFAKKYGLPFTLLADPDKKIIKTYGATGEAFKTRVSFLIDPQGKILKIYPEVDVEKHADEILEDLKKLAS